MRRRTVLTTGALIVFGSIAGCLGFGEGGDEELEPTTEADGTTEPQTETETTETGGELSFSAEPSTTEIEWGDEYAVEVTVQAGDEPTQIATELIYQTEEDSSLSGTLGDSRKTWQVDAGETATETFTTQAPSTGAWTVGLMNIETEQVVDEWELTVQPPTAAFGETISYYDGLDLTLDAEINEWMDFELEYGPIGEEEHGVFSVSPRNGKWVKFNVVAENTNEEGEVTLPPEGQFSGLAGNSSLAHDTPRSLGQQVGDETQYEIDDPPNGGGDGPVLIMYKPDDLRQDGYWYPSNDDAASPPTDIDAGDVEEGWIVFAVQEEEFTVDDLEIRLDRRGLDVRAVWINE